MFFGLMTVHKMYIQRRIWLHETFQKTFSIRNNDIAFCTLRSTLFLLFRFFHFLHALLSSSSYKLLSISILSHFEEVKEQKKIEASDFIVKTEKNFLQTWTRIFLLITSNWIEQEQKKSARKIENNQVHWGVERKNIDRWKMTAIWYFNDMDKAFSIE